MNCVEKRSGSIKELDDSDIRLPHEGHIPKGHAECHGDRSTVLLETATGHGEAPVYVMNPSQPDLAVSYAILAIGTERSHVGEKFLEDRTWLLDSKEPRLCIVIPCA